MKLHITKATLTKALKIVGRAVSSSSSLPVLGNVLLQASDSKLRVAATNLELAITCQVEAKIEQGGSITVPAKLFAQVVDAMPEGELSLTLNPKNFTVTVSGTRRTANVKGITAEDFPPIPSVEGETKLTLDPKLFREAITQTTIAAAKDDVRPALAGILCEFEGDKLSMAAADGYRLAVRTLALPACVPVDTSIIVPAKALGELGRLIGDDTETVDLVPNDKYIVCHLSKSNEDVPSIDVTSRLIMGNFPHYRSLIPTSHATRVEANVDELVSALRLVSPFSQDVCHCILLEMGAESTLLILRNKAAECGEGIAEVDATLEGEPLQVALDARYFGDALGAVATERVALETNGTSQPVVIKQVGHDDYVYVVMPMTVKGEK